MVLNNRLRQPVLIENLETGDRKEFASMTEAGLYLDVARLVVRRHIDNNIPLKAYLITKLSAVISSPSANTPTGKGQHVLLKNQETGDSKEFSSLKAADAYLGVSEIRLWRHFNSGYEASTIKGYKITKVDHSLAPVKSKRKAIEVTNIHTNEVTIYPSATLAAQALSVSSAIISQYFSQNRITPLKGKYLLKLA